MASQTTVTSVGGSLITVHRSPFLLRFAHLMFQRGDFVLHLAHFHARDCTTWLVQQINERAWQAADQNDKETKGTNENGLGFRHSTKTAEHDLQNLFPKTDSRETDG